MLLIFYGSRCLFQGDGTRSTSAASDPVDFTAYQTLMEEVLVWLLAAEDHLDSAPAIDVELQTVKEQFHKHEVMLRFRLTPTHLSSVFAIPVYRNFYWNSHRNKGVSASFYKKGQDCCRKASSLKRRRAKFASR